MTSSKVKNGTSPQDPWRMIPVVVQRTRIECKDVHTLDLDFSDPEEKQTFKFEPGQFNMLYVPGVGEAAISIAGLGPHQSGLRHTIRDVGSVTHAITGLSEGAMLGLRGPFGKPWPLQSLLTGGVEELIVVAGGIGLAPLRGVVGAFVHHRQEIRMQLLVGARSQHDLLYRNEYTAWQDAGIALDVTLDRDDTNWRGHVGVVTLLLERSELRYPARTAVFTCGPEVMMRYVARTAIERGIPANQCWVTLERHMNCAIGHCGHCQLGSQIVCRDGPVFNYESVQDLLRVRDL